MKFVIAAPCLQLFLPCGNFDEDYGISERNSMEKWQAGAKSVNFAGGMQQ
jgi:hypothetical protein